MIAYDAALRAVLAHAAPLPSRRAGIDDARNAVLARPVRARWDMPRFAQSSVDGFGVKTADVARAVPRRPATLVLAGVVRAGERPRGRLRAGTAVKIMTGARVPPGVEAIVMREHCRERDGAVHIAASARPGENIRRRGEELRRGEPVLPAGARVTPPVAGVLASFGLSAVPVHGTPRVAVVTTGDELRALGQRLSGDGIYDSISHALDAALSAMGIAVRSVARVRDDKAALARALAGALATHDVVLTAGGVSVGDYDHVKEALAALDVEPVFWRVAMRPGKPTFFGVRRPPRRARCAPPRARRATLVFGLPGNPVSALVAFATLAAPALRAMMGAREAAPIFVPAVLRGTLRKEAGHIGWVRGVLAATRGLPAVAPCRAQGSHMLSGLAGANCLIRFPRNATRLARGARVSVLPLPWSP